MASEATILVQSNGHTLTLPTVAFQGLPSTLCKGCGHNSITSHLIEACKSIGVNPYTTVKLSGIGCSSKTPAYFLQASHGFNALHGRMPSVATGALMANGKLLVHRHQRRRRHGEHRHGAVQAHLPPQRADRLHHRGQRLLRPDQGPVLGDRRPERPPPPPDRRGERHRPVRHLRRGDRRRRHVRGPVVRRRQEADGAAPEGGARSTRGPRSWTSSARASPSTTSTARPRAGTGPRSTRSRSTRSASSRGCPRSRSSRSPASRPASSSTTARGSRSRRCGTRSTTSPTASRPSGSWRRASAKNEFLTGLLYVEAKRKDFVTLQNMPETPLALLPDEALRPSEDVLKKIMETI